ncbi:thiamine diphosphokinase [soil metagenome]|jgi:thiamine pyrophosphokinase
MSSHHVVREKQEPALLILGMDSFPGELLGQLLEWSPTVIVTADTAEKMNSLGIKIDWIIAGDEAAALQSDVKVLPGGFDGYIASALTYLVSSGYPAVNIVTDEFDLADYESFAGEINLVVFSRDKKIFPVTSGFSKWKPHGEVIELLSIPARLKTTGLEMINEHHYKTTADGFYSLSFDTPYLFIAEEI